jgi:hypothetical protein
MSPVDDTVERGADKLEELSRKAARAGGVKAKLAQPLAEDAEFLRKLKPSLIAARAKGNAPTDGEATQVTAPEPAPAPSTKKAKQPKQSGGGGGPNPFVVIAAMLALGMILAHVVDWLGHRYPRD